MANDLMDILRELVTPMAEPGPVVPSAAPGTNERDVLREGQDYASAVPQHALSPAMPDRWRRARSSGPGQSGLLGYADHGDAVRIATRRNENTRRRFPDLATHGRPGPAAPEYNQIYDVLKSPEAYDKIIIGTAHGQWTVGTTVNPQPVILDNPLPPNLLNQFPGSVQAFPVLLVFTFSQSILTATGCYSMSFTPDGGDISYPLGEYNAGIGSEYNSMRHIIRAPFTDPGKTVLGTFNVATPTAVVGTPVINWRLAFGLALFLAAPAFKTSHPLHVLDWIDRAPEVEEELDNSMPPGGVGGAGRRG